MEVKGWWAGDTEEKKKPVDISYDGNLGLNDWSSGWWGDRGSGLPVSPSSSHQSFATVKINARKIFKADWSGNRVLLQAANHTSSSHQSERLR